MKRVGAKGEGKFERISWDEALGIIHDRVGEVISRHGRQAVLPLNYAGPHGMLAGDSMSLRFFHKMGASLLSRRPLCGGVRGEAYAGTFGATPGTPLQQVDLAKLIIVWGNNATACNLHLMRHINVAKRNGAKLVVIDPKRVKVAEQAHLHLPIRPGTDVVLGLGAGGRTGETGGLDRAFIEKHVHGFEPFMQSRASTRLNAPPKSAALLSRISVHWPSWYRESAPAVIALGQRPRAQPEGGSGLRAIAALPALAGKFGVAGGGLVGGAGHAFPKTADILTRPDLVPQGHPHINIIEWVELLDDKLDPPLKALFVYNHNPLIVHPEQNVMKQALAREDLFIAGIEVAMTDSMAYAE